MEWWTCDPSAVVKTKKLELSGFLLCSVTSGFQSGADVGNVASRFTLTSETWSFYSSLLVWGVVTFVSSWQSLSFSQTVDVGGGIILSGASETSRNLFVGRGGFRLNALTKFPLWNTNGFQLKPSQASNKISTALFFCLSHKRVLMELC